MCYLLHFSVGMIRNFYLLWLRFCNNWWVKVYTFHWKKKNSSKIILIWNLVDHFFLSYFLLKYPYSFLHFPTIYGKSIHSLHQNCFHNFHNYFTWHICHFNKLTVYFWLSSGLLSCWLGRYSSGNFSNLQRSKLNHCSYFKSLISCVHHFRFWSLFLTNLIIWIIEFWWIHILTVGIPILV